MSRPIRRSSGCTARASSGVLSVGAPCGTRGCLPQAADLAAGRPAREVTLAERGSFCWSTVDLLLAERVDEAAGFRHTAPRRAAPIARRRAARGRERWVINKLRALCSWYTKGFENGSHLRVAVNQSESIRELHDHMHDFSSSDGISRPPLQTAS